ncbi:hypothetical protein [Clostridium puniceum]|nr:hypothetical protein [Clostridium puniceum]
MVRDLIHNDKISENKINEILPYDTNISFEIRQPLKVKKRFKEI